MGAAGDGVVVELQGVCQIGGRLCQAPLAGNPPAHTLNDGVGGGGWDQDLS